MSDSTVWWILAGCLVGAELLTGTFYLLMIALGAVAAAVAAQLGASMVTQVLTAATVGGVAVVGWHLLRQRKGPVLRASANKDVNLDIGEIVQVTAWSAARETTVQFRGAEWSASLAPQAPQGNGPHRIVEVLGSRLVLHPVSG